MMLLDRLAMADLLAPGRPEVQRVRQQPAPHLERAAGHDVVERRHALEQGDVLEGAGDALAGGEVGPHVVALLALEGDGAFLRVVEAVDDVEHRRLAGAVGADDGADLALPDVEGDAADRPHAAEGKRDVLHREQHLVGGTAPVGHHGLGLDIGLHSAASLTGSAAARRIGLQRRRCAHRPRRRPCGRPRRSSR